MAQGNYNLNELTSSGVEEAIHRLFRDREEDRVRQQWQAREHELRLREWLTNPQPEESNEDGIFK